MTADVNYNLKNIPCIVVQLCDTGNSGWVLKGTERSARPQTLNSPEVRFIPNKGMRARFEDAKDGNGNTLKDAKGNPIQIKINEKIRYIKNQQVISLEQQRLLGVEPAPAGTNEDLIGIKRGEITVWQTGSTIGLFNYLIESYYNESNPNREATATAIYRIVNVNEESEALIESDDSLLDGLQYLKALKKVEGNQYTYNDEKIDMLCDLFTCEGLTAGDKLANLHKRLKFNPKHFMDTVRKNEASVTTEIHHGIQLEVIGFEGNTALFKNPEKIIHKLGAGNFKAEEKIDRLASYFKSKEGLDNYQIFKDALSDAKNKNLQK